MRNSLEWTRRRLSGRPDSEHGQALVRVALILLILCYVLLPSSRSGLDAEQYRDVLAIVLGGLALSLAIFGALLARPGRSDLRRAVGMLADYGLMAAGMIRMGEPLAWVYIVVMWVTVGNGLRYGHRYLLAAVAMAVASFGSVLWFTEFWHQVRALGLGLLAGLVAVPMYLSSLLRQLTRATEEAQRASEAKSRFLANMSHEFRTPLNGLAGMTELLSTTQLDGEQRECVRTIQASTRSLMGLVEDVLDISAIEAGKVKLNPENFSPREALDSVGLILRPQARQKQLEYLVVVDDAVPQQVRGDAVHLRQVLLNLVGNAVKFTDAGRVRVDVTVAGVQEGGGVRLRFVVSDTGIGIPESMRGRVFEAFEQADASLARRYGGTGLGTTIARGLVEAMGGRIGYENLEPRGSRFWFEVPFQPATAAPLRPAVLEEGGQDVAAGDGKVIAFADPFLRHRARVRSMQVLVADDYEANRMVLQRLLQKAGHRVTCVAGGEEVLEAMAERDYDVAIVDLHMPGLSGLDLLRQLRVMQAGGVTQTPVVVLSADVTPESIQRCEKAGAYAFLAKPVAAARLLDVLADVALRRGRRAGAGGTGAREERQPAAAGGPGAVLDPSVLDELAAMGMGLAFEQEFIRHCLSDAEGCLASMQQAGEDADWSRLRDHAHAIKGVAANMGLVRVAELGGVLMRLPEWQMRNEWREHLARLVEALAQGRQALDARVAARDGGARDRGDS
ncbi:MULTISPECIES: ATP-binding protein [Pseudoxanthomonas]|uniref:Sensory/regulatory protein RpfC n=1 Tax=Pseudoxanthomonas taiwanensis J19 TaxID=935569 RepID=A0A562DMF2_9GAMM|nr:MULTISPECIES: ATP-binding protein [Pseudoxanthomonas]TWH10842.1 two-component system sensor histidine kinase RpfC [Pseudoxanthomonas taiwanensis J19]